MERVRRNQKQMWPWSPVLTEREVEIVKGQEMPKRQQGSTGFFQRNHVQFLGYTSSSQLPEKSVSSFVLYRHKLKSVGDTGVGVRDGVKEHAKHLVMSLERLPISTRL